MAQHEETQYVHMIAESQNYSSSAFEVHPPPIFGNYRIDCSLPNFQQTYAMRIAGQRPVFSSNVNRFYGFIRNYSCLLYDVARHVVLSQHLGSSLSN